MAETGGFMVTHGYATSKFWCVLSVDVARLLDAEPLPNDPRTGHSHPGFRDDFRERCFIFGPRKSLLKEKEPKKKKTFQDPFLPKKNNKQCFQPLPSSGARRPGAATPPSAAFGTWWNPRSGAAADSSGPTWRSAWAKKAPPQLGRCESWGKLGQNPWTTWTFKKEKTKTVVRKKLL